MGCLLVLMSAFAPRLVFILIWIARPALVDSAFDTFIFPLLGLIFLPFTTLIWLFLAAGASTVHGIDWLWIGLAVILDLSHYGNTWGQRDQLTSSPPSGPPAPASPTMPTGH